jgi:hypothetical protein
MFGRRFGLSLALAALCLPGCLAIRKRTLIIHLPEDSRQVRLHYVFEGLGVRSESERSLEIARDQVDTLSENGYGFFAQLPKSLRQDESPGTRHQRMLALFRFEKIRWFRDESADRPLAGDRRVTITDIDAFLKILNEPTSTDPLRSGEDLLRDIESFDKQLADPTAREMFRAVSAEPLLEVAEAIQVLARRIDLPSARLLVKRDDFRAIRVHGGRLILVLRATPEWAKEVAGSADAEKVRTRLERMVKPVVIRATDEGLEFAFGKPGEPIVLTWEDPSVVDRTLEASLAASLGNPKPIVENGKPLTAARLIGSIKASDGRSRAPAAIEPTPNGIP